MNKEEPAIRLEHDSIERSKNQDESSLKINRYPAIKFYELPKE
jgi:hypothetical protein